MNSNDQRDDLPANADPDTDAEKKASKWIFFGYVSMLSWCIFAGILITSEMRQQHAIWRDMDHLRRRENVEAATEDLAKNEREAVLYLVQELQQAPHRDQRIRLTTGLGKILDDTEADAKEAIAKLIDKTLMSQETERLVLALRDVVKREATAEKPYKELIEKLQKIADGVMSLELAAGEQNTLLAISADIEKHKLRWREKKALKSFVENWKVSITSTTDLSDSQNPKSQIRNPKSSKGLYSLSEAELSNVLKVCVLNDNRESSRINTDRIDEHSLRFADENKLMASVMENFRKSLSKEDEHAPEPTNIEKQTVLFVLIQPIAEDLKKEKAEEQKKKEEEEKEKKEDSSSQADGAMSAEAEKEPPAPMDPDTAAEILSKKEWSVTKDQKQTMQALLNEAHRRWQERNKTWMSLGKKLVAKAKRKELVEFTQQEKDCAKSFVDDWESIVDKVEDFVSEEGLLSHFVLHATQSQKVTRFTESEKEKICLLCLRLEKEYNESRYQLAKAMREIAKGIQWGAYDVEGDAADMARSLKSVWLQRDEQMLVGEISLLLKDHDHNVRHELENTLVAIGGPAVPWLKKLLVKTKVNPIMAVETKEMSKPERLKLLQAELVIARKAAIRAFEEIGVNLVHETKSPPPNEVLVMSPQAKNQEELASKIRKSQEIRKEHLQMVKETLKTLLADDVVGGRAKEALKRIESGKVSK